MKNQEIYDAYIVTLPDIKRKGKTMPYTSSNGYMFSQLNKEGEIGIRLSKEHQELFKKEHNATIFKSHGAVMKDYVLVPEDLFDKKKLLKSLLLESFNFENSLPPKSTSTKK